MVKKLRAVVTLGAGALAYKVLTKQPIVTDRNVTNATIGAVSGMIAIPKLERIVHGEQDEQENRINRNILVGGALGAAAAYFLTSGAAKKTVDRAVGAYNSYLRSDE